jgi:quinohemoprotein ethanol dehydrogenase
MHAPKNGFFYVIDRETGKLISAEPFTETTWASHIDMETGRPVEIEGARYDQGAVEIMPSTWGAHSWHAMSFNPNTGLVYIPTLHQGMTFTDEGIDLENWKAVKYNTLETGLYLGPVKNPPRDYPASLQAWDPVKQELAWSVPQDLFWNAGTLTTGGNLVFQGRSDGRLLAYNATTGEILWEYDAGLGISAPPITYKINGRQYISLLVGFGGAFSGFGTGSAKTMGWAYGKHMRRLITFSLEGDVVVPEQAPPFYAEPLAAPDFEIDQALANEGAQLYNKCFGCHGVGVYASAMAPDLRASQIPLSQASFASVVREGSLNANGMPRFADLSDKELDALRHFIRKRARETLPEYEALMENLTAME